MNGDALRGHLEFLLLAALLEGDGHGYALIERLRTRSEGVLKLGEGSVYPALRRLESSGFVRSSWEPGDRRRKRVYRLTQAGREKLNEERQSWGQLVRTVELVVAVS
jgi:PadR family transcriptional regulator, regulatory protein PadR